jgi:hypothetical protein
MLSPAEPFEFEIDVTVATLHVVNLKLYTEAGFEIEQLARLTLLPGQLTAAGWAKAEHLSDCPL